MKTEELVKKCQDRMKSIRDKIETKRKSKKVYSEEEVLKLLEKSHFVEENIYEWFEKFKKK
jgi:exonuclease I